MTLKQAKAQLASIGVTVNKTVHGEYRVSVVGGTEASAYYATDLDEAVATGIAMAKRNPTYKKYGGKRGAGEFRPMTVEEAKLLNYGDHIWIVAVDGSARQVKVNGAVKRWKRDLNRIEVPFKYGMYEYGTLYNRDFGHEGGALVEI